MFFTINKDTAINSNNITCIERKDSKTIIYFGSSQNIEMDMSYEVHQEMLDMLKGEV